MSKIPNRRITKPVFENINESTVIMKAVSSIKNRRGIITYNAGPGYAKWLMFGQGKKDDWCVYSCVGIIRPDGRKEMLCYIPRDIYYFERISWLGSALQDFGISSEMVYGHFYYLYVLSSLFKKDVSPIVINYIKALVTRYYTPFDKYADFNLSEMVLEQFLLVYLAMVAEEFYIRSNNEPSIFGCAIKILAIHEILISHRPYKEVAHQYNCKSGNEILKEAERVGIVRL